MLADETFPVELDEELLHSPVVNSDGYASGETMEASMFSSSNTDISNTTCSKSFANGENFSQDETFESTFKSLDQSNRRLTLQVPRAPVKPKKSFSCHDLMNSKKNYDHVESKVKKIIENMNEQSKRTTLSRHKSMPLSTYPPIDDTFNAEKDASVLIKELRRKSVRIYELEEKCEERDSRIYALEYERSKMKMTFDDLRIELHDLKVMEKSYNQLIEKSSPKLLKNASVQTEDYIERTATVSGCKADPRLLPTHIARELTYGNDNAGNFSLNQSDFSELNNASSDNLIAEMSLEEIDITRTVEGCEHENTSRENKKPKKLRRFLKMISCVSK